jgi:CBS domain-containing protein
MTARELMTPEPFVATGDTTLNELAYHMLQYDCGAIPIVADPESRRLVGIVTDRDIIARAVSRDRNPMSVRADDVMSTDVKAVSPDAPLEELIELFRRERFRRVPIVDQERRVIGIVSLADLVRKAPLRQRAEVDRAVRDVLSAP